MAKKSRRARRAPAAAAPASITESSAVAQPVRITRSIRPPTAAATHEVDFPKEYHYVLQDLKRIGILAAGLFVLLIVLALLFA